jgi:hypothetical protein
VVVVTIGHVVAAILVIAIVGLQILDIERDGWPARQRRRNRAFRRELRRMRSR